VTVDDWRTTTGPLDFQDLERLLADPYLRDAAGRFAPHPADRPRSTRMKRTIKQLPVRVVTFGAGGGGMIGYEGGDSTIAVPAPRCPHGHFARWARKNCTGCAKRR
jgi:hypothetical protein